MNIALYTAMPITVAYGDGIGPEIMEATLHVLREAEAQLNIETIEVGQRIYDMEARAGILPSAWEVLQRTGILLQAPVAEPEDRDTLMNELRHRMGIHDGRREVFSDFAADAHFGENFALFTCAHGLELEERGKNTADPSSMLLAACMMLEYGNQAPIAARIRRALLIARSKDAQGTRAFVKQIIEHLWT